MVVVFRGIPLAMPQETRSHAAQMIGSLVVAAVIVLITIAIVTAQMPLDRLPKEDREERSERRDDRRDSRREEGPSSVAEARLRVAPGGNIGSDRAFLPLLRSY